MLRKIRNFFKNENKDQARTLREKVVDLILEEYNLKIGEKFLLGPGSWVYYFDEDRNLVIASAGDYIFNEDIGDIATGECKIKKINEKEAAHIEKEIEENWDSDSLK